MIVPVYNGARWLGEALDSVLGQGVDEVLVVDDGSQDHTPEVVRGFPQVRYFRQENAGPAAARNAGLARVGGDCLAFIDADDLWPEGKLAWQKQLLAEDPELQVVLGRVEWQGVEGFSEPLISFQFGAALVRKAAFAEVGALNERLPYSEDTDWFLRCREGGIKMHLSSRVGLIYRRHQENLTNDRQRSNRYLVQALKYSLDRRRCQQGPAEAMPSLLHSAGDAEAVRYLHERVL